MGREKHTLPPSLIRTLKVLGENIRLARLRRQYSTTLLAERAGISRNTLRAIEKGESSVTFAGYASVLFCLGLAQDLLAVAHDDELGRKLQDANLPLKVRAPKKKSFNLNPDKQQKENKKSDD